MSGLLGLTTVGLAGIALGILRHDATLVINVVVGHFDVSRHRRIGNNSATVFLGFRSGQFFDVVRDNDPSHEFGFFIFDVHASADGQTAAEQDEQDEHTDEDEHVTGDEEGALTRVQLTALFFVGKETDRCNVKTLSIGTEEANKLFIFLEVDKHSVLLATRRSCAINLAASRVEDNRLKT